jgi:hypothetical protein
MLTQVNCDFRPVAEDIGGSGCCFFLSCVRLALASGCCGGESRADTMGTAGHSSRPSRRIES